MNKKFEIQKLQRISYAFSMSKCRWKKNIDTNIKIEVYNFRVLAAFCSKSVFDRNLLQIFLNQKLEHQSHCFPSSIFIILVRIKAWLSFLPFYVVMFLVSSSQNQKIKHGSKNNNGNKTFSRTPIFLSDNTTK